jgi:putative DNA primase/helicase
MSYERVPLDLHELDQWILFRYEQRKGKPKPTKVPYQVRDPKRKAKSTDPATWAPFEQAVEAVEHADGIGFVFPPNEEFTGIDFDDCVTDGEIHPHVAACLLTLNSYSEFSPSGTGVHAIVRARVNGGRKVTGDTPWGGKLETYSKGRFFTITGNHVPGTNPYVQERQAQLDEIRAELLPDPEPVQQPPRRVTDAVPDDDRDLLERAKNAKNGADFDRLYRGDTSAHNDDHSAADLALTGQLAFWCGIDPDRIDRLFRSSGLMREKWDETRGESTYGRMTVERSLRSRAEFAVFLSS